MRVETQCLHPFKERLGSIVPADLNQPLTNIHITLDKTSKQRDN